MYAISFSILLLETYNLMLSKLFKQEWKNRYKMTNLNSSNKWKDSFHSTYPSITRIFLFCPNRSWCFNLFTYCWIQFANTLLKIFHLCSWGVFVYSSIVMFFSVLLSWCWPHKMSWGIFFLFSESFAKLIFF